MKVRKEGEALLEDILANGEAGETVKRGNPVNNTVAMLSAKLEALALEKPHLTDEIKAFYDDATKNGKALEEWQTFYNEISTRKHPDVVDEETEDVAPPAPPPPPQSVVLEEEETEEKKISVETAKMMLRQPVWQKTTPFVGKPDGNAWEYMELPSGYIFYDFDQMFVRPLVTRDLRKLSPVVKSDSVSLMLDVLGATMSVDPRILTQEDFYFVLYWLRAKSLPKSPMIVNWTSRYGVKDVTTIQRTALEETRLNKEEHGKYFEEMKARGLDWPRMYDLESSDGADFDMIEPGFNWLYGHSRYFKALPGETIRQRMDRIDEGPLEPMELARDMKIKLVHGIKEFTPVTLDLRKFDPAKALEELETKAASLIQINSVADDPELATMIEDLVEEIEEIKDKMDKGVEIKPRPERLRALVNISSFFPGL